MAGAPSYVVVFSSEGWTAEYTSPGVDREAVSETLNFVMGEVDLTLPHKMSRNYGSLTVSLIVTPHRCIACVQSSDQKPRPIWALLLRVDALSRAGRPSPEQLAECISEPTATPPPRRLAGPLTPPEAAFSPVPPAPSLPPLQSSPPVPSLPEGNEMGEMSEVDLGLAEPDSSVAPGSFGESEGAGEVQIPVRGEIVPVSGEVVGDDLFISGPGAFGRMVAQRRCCAVWQRAEKWAISICAALAVLGIVLFFIAAAGLIASLLENPTP